MQTVVQLNAPPNTHVFTLQARDPDTDSNIHYFIVRDRSTYEFNITCINADIYSRYLQNYPCKCSIVSIEA